MRARMTDRIAATTRVEGARVKPRPSPINMKMRLYVVLMVLAETLANWLHVPVNTPPAFGS
jgi:hypothetical protein